MNNLVVLKNDFKISDGKGTKKEFDDSCLNESDDFIYIRDIHKFKELSKDLVKQLDECEKQVREQYGYLLY